MLRIDRHPITHRDAVALIERVQAEYVVRYGGPDETPIDPAHFEDPEGAFFIGYADEVPVAMGGWRRRPVPPDVLADSTVEVKRMYVVPEARGLGYARQVLAHLESSALAAGSASIVLETGLRQPEAMALYESAGYTSIAGFGYYADAPLSRCYAKVFINDRAHSPS
ncbi:MAG: GNAT family N-acetyltransferase [Marmoricola sp.]